GLLMFIAAADDPNLRWWWILIGMFHSLWIWQELCIERAHNLIGFIHLCQLSRPKVVQILLKHRSSGRSGHRQGKHKHREKGPNTIIYNNHQHSCQCSLQAILFVEKKGNAGHTTEPKQQHMEISLHSLDNLTKIFTSPILQYLGLR
ncbi:hypothetical protein ACJX0J_016714, partial [Zea mays]